MANKDAGNTLQQAIADGRAKQCKATCKATGERCNRVARNGYDVCQVHGAGTAIREEEGKKNPPGRPVIHGMYSTVLKEDEMDLYAEAFGDLTLVQEAAVAKVKLASYLRKMAEDVEALECNEEDGQIDLTVVSKPDKKPQDKEAIFMRMLETTVRTVTAAYDQLRDKKIVVTMQGNDPEMMEKVQEAVTKEMSFINGQLCPDCRRRIIEAIGERQQTIVDG